MSTLVKNKFILLRNSSSLLKILTIALFIASCAKERREVDISNTDLSTEILRLDVDLFENTNDELNEEDILAIVFGLPIKYMEMRRKSIINNKAFTDEDIIRIVDICRNALKGEE